MQHKNGTSILLDRPVCVQLSFLSRVTPCWTESGLSWKRTFEAEFLRLDVFPVTRPTASKNWREFNTMNDYDRHNYRVQTKQWRLWIADHGLLTHRNVSSDMLTMKEAGACKQSRHRTTNSNQQPSVNHLHVIFTGSVQRREIMTRRVRDETDAATYKQFSIPRIGRFGT